MLSIGRPIELPAEGVLTKEGFLFHHVSTHRLQQFHIERLLECGIPIRAGFFKPDEDKILKENWEKFIKEEGLTTEQLMQYLSIVKSDIPVPVRLRSLLDWNFWPRIASGLPQRNGTQVKRRLLKLFDPQIVSGKREVMYSKKTVVTEEMKRTVLDLRGEGKSWEEIAAALQLTIEEVTNLYNREARKPTVILKTEYKLFFKLVLKIMEEETRERVKQYALEGRTSKLLKLSRILDFTKVAEEMGKDYDCCQQTWNAIAIELSEKVKTFKESGLSDDESWKYSVKKVTRRVRVVSIEEVIQFVKILKKKTDPEVLYIGVHLHTIYNFEELRTCLREAGIHGFYSSNKSELDYLISKVSTMLRRIDHAFFEKLTFKFTMRERLEMLIMYLKTHKNFAKYTGERKYEFKTVTAIPPVYRDRFLTVVIKFTQKHHPDFEPPRFWGKYIDNTPKKSGKKSKELKHEIKQEEHDEGNISLFTGVDKEVLNDYMN